MHTCLKKAAGRGSHGETIHFRHCGHKTKAHFPPETAFTLSNNAYPTRGQMRQHEIDMPNPRRIYPTRPYFITRIGVSVELVWVHVWPSRIFGYQHVGVGTMKCFCWRVIPNARPQREGFRVLVEYRLDFFQHGLVLCPQTRCLHISFLYSNV